ncbi:MAG TPA: DUF1573 domain-containing protein [Verrucomicrobiae bacterium]|nr:DUF1573 domain-containing protein [Verrucomicrobiae bacterium]
MFSLKRSVVAAALTGLSLALMAGCKTSQPESVKTATPPVAQTNPPPSAPVKPLPDTGDSMAPNILAWDSLSKDYHAKPGEMKAPFSFSLTNVSSKPIVIYDTSTSCDCTVAHLPSNPWTIPSGGSGKIEASINLSNKVGIVTNSVIVYTSKGNRRLYVKAFTAESK